MRPLSLEIEGFTAFRERQQIDFRELELFVITGPTGAGKTSILDALTFALYGQVPRLGGRQGTADLVSLGTPQARLMFEFSIKGKGRYRVARRLRRHGAQSATVERLEGEGWVSACQRDGVRECERVLGELLGLDFDSFCKAVMLPQGEFHRFLKGDPGERRRVLVSLLGVSYFERMGALARTRQSDLTSRVERTEEIILEQYSDASAEQLSEAQAASRAAVERSRILTTALAASEKQLADAVAHRARAKALSAGADDLEQIAAASLQTLESCRLAEAGASEARAALESSTSAAQSAQHNLKEAEDFLRALEEQSGTLEELAKAALAAETVLSADAEQSAAEAKLTAAQDAHSAAEQELTAAREEEAAAQPLLTQSAAAQEAASAALEKAVEHARALTAHAKELASALEQLQRATEQRRTSETTVRSARAKVEELDGALERAMAHLEEHRRANAVAELTDGLSVSDPCPVCGVALGSPPVVPVDVVQTLLSARESEQSVRNAAESARASAARAEANVEAAELAFSACEKRYSEALDGRSGPPALESELGEATAAVEDANATLATAKHGLEVAQGSAAQARERRVSAETALEGKAALREQAGAALQNVRARREGAAAILEDRFAGAPPSDAAARIAADRERLVFAGEAATAARGELERAEQARERANEMMRGSESHLATLDNELTRLRTLAETTWASLGGDLSATGLPATPDASGARDADAGSLVTWCTDARTAALDARGNAEQQRAACDAQIIAINREHEGSAADAERAVSELRTNELDARDAASRAQSARQQSERRLRERSEMERGVKQERAEIAVLAQLVGELRGDRFGEYIVTETLQLLAAHASQELLRISDGRYSLITEDGDFDVIDHANADERRSVKTLSGGETFLASLALALSLSRHVGDLAGDGLGAKLEAVFIDEGFGTLDPETLDEVIDALERLRAENLMVGVISHVPELAERVRSGLEVHKDQGRSTIIRSSAA